MSTSETRPTREGEHLDDHSLALFLKANGFDGRVDVEQFPAGSSNLTYLVRVGSNEFVLRRPPFGNTVKTAHDMRREFEVLSKLAQVYPPAPKPLLFCDDSAII